VWRLAASESRRTEGAAPPSVLVRTIGASEMTEPAVGDVCDQRGRQAGGVSARGNLAAGESRPTESATPPFGPYCAPAR
jgi:hypothetical protein